MVEYQIVALKSVGSNPIISPLLQTVQLKFCTLVILVVLHFLLYTKLYKLVFIHL
jgi:hypothetical protein